jgi:uncharacterized coiled-coil protein SlyX
MLQFKQRAAGELETAKGPHQQPRKTAVGNNNQPRHQMPSYVSALNSHTTVPFIPALSLPSLVSTIQPSPLAGACGGQDAKLLALVQSLQQRLDDVESTAAQTISELEQVKKNLVATETKADTLQGAMKSLYHQTTAFQIEQRESAGLAAENMSKLMLKLGVSPAVPSSPPPRRQPNLDPNSIREAWSNDPVVDPINGSPEMALAAGHRNQQASSYLNAAHSEKGIDRRVNQASSGDHG